MAENNPYQGTMAEAENLGSRGEPRGSSSRGRIALAVTAILVTGGLFAAVVTSQGNFNRIFADFGTVMPVLTNIARSAWFMGIVGLLFGLTIVKEFVLKDRVAKMIWDNFAIVLTFLLGGFYAVAMFLPLVIGIHSLS